MYLNVCLSRPYYFKFFKGCLPHILLGPFLNTLTHICYVMPRTSWWCAFSGFKILNFLGFNFLSVYSLIVFGFVFMAFRSWQEYYFYICSMTLNWVYHWLNSICCYQIKNSWFSLVSGIFVLIIPSTIKIFFHYLFYLR